MTKKEFIKLTGEDTIDVLEQDWQDQLDDNEYTMDQQLREEASLDII